MWLSKGHDDHLIIRDLHFIRMAVLLHGQDASVTVKATGTKCTVPNDPVIKIAYYLSAVHATSVPESIPSRYTSWERLLTSPFELRSRMALRELLDFAEDYSPSEMCRRGFFCMVSPSTTLPGNSSNEFYTVTATSREVALLATSEAGLVLINNTSASVKVMLYKECWEDNNYYNPRQELYSMLRESSSGCNVY
jgi:hypothetical protein